MATMLRYIQYRRRTFTNHTMSILKTILSQATFRCPKCFVLWASVPHRGMTLQEGMILQGGKPLQELSKQCNMEAETT